MDKTKIEKIKQNMDTLYNQQGRYRNQINKLLAYVRDHSNSADPSTISEISKMKESIKDLEEKLAEVDELLLRIDRLCKPSS